MRFCRREKRITFAQLPGICRQLGLAKNLDVLHVRLSKVDQDLRRAVGRGQMTPTSSELEVYIYVALNKS